MTGATNSIRIGVQGPVHPTLKPYYPPPPDPRVTIRIDSNEGPGIDASVLSVLQTLTPEALARYPKATELEALIAEQYRVSPDCVLATAGGDDALTRVCNAFLDDSRNAVYATPTFEMIPRGVRITGAAAKTVDWWSGCYPADDACSLVDQHTGVAFLVTPNNPTGLGATIDDARALANRLNKIGNGGILVVDLAYAEFDANDLTGIIHEHANTVLVRTFSKAWSLAGIRLGYAVGAQHAIDALRAIGNPYAVTTPSITIGTHLARSGSILHGSPALVTRVLHERQQLTTLLASLGFEVTPSQANFVFAQHPAAAEFHEALLQLGVSVRFWPKNPELCGALRVTCPGNDAEFAAVCIAFQNTAAARAT